MSYDKKSYKFHIYTFDVKMPGLEVIKLEFILRLKIKGNDWLLVYWLLAAASASSQSLRFILSPRLYSSFNFYYFTLAFNNFCYLYFRVQGCMKMTYLGAQRCRLTEASPM